MSRRRQARREKRSEETQTFGRGGSATRYKMRQRLASFGQDFFIENERSQKAYKVDGKVLRLRDTLNFKDLHGNVLCNIQQKVARIRDTMDVDGPDGRPVASVKKALITPVRERWTVKIGGGPDMQVQVIFSTMSTISALVARSWPRFPRNGSAFEIPTACRLHRVRTMRLSWL